MKIQTCFLTMTMLTITVFQLSAQDTLVYMDRIYAPNEELTAFPDYWHGVYENDQGVTWEVNAKKISSVSLLYLRFSKDELQAKENYQLRNGYLLGFIEDDSIPVLEKNDTVYFAYTHKKDLFKIHSNDQVLVKDENEQVLYFYNYQEDIDAYEIIKFTLLKGVLSVAYLDQELLLSQINTFKRRVKYFEGQKSQPPYFLVKNKKVNFQILTKSDVFEIALKLPFQKKIE